MAGVAGVKHSSLLFVPRERCVSAVNVNTTDATAGLRHCYCPLGRVNVNTTDATTGATARLLPAQNTHTSHDLRDAEHARAGGVEDGLGVVHLKTRITLACEQYPAVVPGHRLLFVELSARPRRNRVRQEGFLFRAAFERHRASVACCARRAAFDVLSTRPGRR